jgi:hypothetical protein
MAGATLYVACAALTVVEAIDTARKARREMRQRALAKTYAAAASQKVRRHKGYVNLEETDLRRS